MYLNTVCGLIHRRTVPVRTKATTRLVYNAVGMMRFITRLTYTKFCQGFSQGLVSDSTDGINTRQVANRLSKNRKDTPAKDDIHKLSSIFLSNYNQKYFSLK